MIIPVRAARLGLIAALVAMVAGSSSCGYALAGRGSFLPDYIRTIGIPLFVNQTTVFDVEQLLSQRVRAEFIGRGKYRVTPDATGADAVLTGTIANITLAPSAFNDQQFATRYAVTVVMRIEFRDLREDKVLWENPSLVFREEFEVTTGSGALDVNAFFGQSSNALERVASEFARSVVTSILEAF